ncbi:MAG: sulfotransferase [Alphaproteobacteria bacterium]|nr:sulfotransferase [Alphaproteobacteria bacterium]
MSEAAVTPDMLLRAAAGHRDAGRLASAIDAYEAALRLRPAMPNSWYNLALLLRRVGRFDDALAAYDRALWLGIRGPEEVHLNRAVIFADDLGRADLAESALRDALALAPAYVPALLNLGNLHEDRGEAQAAADLYARAHALDPSAATPLARLLGLAALAGPGEALAAEARSRLARPETSDAERAEIGFALAGALDRGGAWDDAFAAATAANAAQRRASRSGYDRAAHEALVDRIIAASPAATPPARAPEGKAPLFILGLFRSGSTLAEQILAQGEGVATGGELDIVAELAAAIPGYPEALAALSDEAAAGLRADYLARLDAMRGQAAFHTDKRPDNFLHLGFIKRLFPEARIIHTVRDPADTAVSQFFLHLDPAMAYATDLADIAHWQRQYRRLMAHWETLWPQDIHRLDYDALVAAPRPAIEALFRFAGIPHDAAALDYGGTARAVRTASAGQVHQPLYARASGRWRHYARQLAPYVDDLRG